jgi:hypothetical protein
MRKLFLFFITLILPLLFSYAQIKTEYRSSRFNIIDSFYLPIPAPSGVCFDGKYLWITNYSAARGERSIYKLDYKSKRIIDSLLSPSQWTTGISYDGVNLIVMDYYNQEPSMIIITTTGNILRTIPIIYSCYWGGIVWKNNYVFYGVNICDVPDRNYSSMIYKIDYMSGSLIDSIYPPSGNINGLALSVNRIWYSDEITKRIYAIDQSRNETESYFSPGPRPGVLTYANGYLWHIDFSRKILYQIDIGESPPIPSDVTISSGLRRVKLLWTVPNNNSIVSFKIYRGENQQYSLSKLIDSIDGKNTEYTDYSVINDKTYYYWITSIDTSNNESHASEAQIGKPAVPIPYNLFVTVDTSKVYISWSDLSHQGIRSYNIYRNSIIPSGEEIIKDSVVAPKSSYVDNTFKKAGKYFYQITSVDTLGVESEKSSPIVAEPILPSSIWLSPNYPNPASFYTTFQYGAGYAFIGSLEVFNSIGQLIESKRVTTSAAGYNSIKWNTSFMSNGLYFVRLNTGKEFRIIKMLVQK